MITPLFFDYLPFLLHFIRLNILSIFAQERFWGVTQSFRIVEATPNPLHASHGGESRCAGHMQKILDGKLQLVRLIATLII